MRLSSLLDPLRGRHAGTAFDVREDLVPAAVWLVLPLALLDSNPEGVLAIFAFIWFPVYGVWLLLLSFAMLTEQELAGDG